MPISVANKEKIIDRFMDTARKGHRIEISLRFQGEMEEADKVARENRKLSSKVDKLIAQAMRQWQGSAVTVITEMKRSNRNLQVCVNSIRKKIKVAQNVVKALGHIDNAIEAAGKLIA
jgi:uncharacterized protein YbbC (DUF1343 family)